MAKRPLNRPAKPAADPIEGATGASDANNGGGSGSGTPDAETGMRAESAIRKGDKKRDAEKLFPDRQGRPENQPKS